MGGTPSDRAMPTVATTPPAPIVWRRPTAATTRSAIRRPVSMPAEYTAKPPAAKSSPAPVTVRRYTALHVLATSPANTMENARRPGTATHRSEKRTWAHPRGWRAHRSFALPQAASGGASSMAVPRKCTARLTSARTTRAATPAAPSAPALNMACARQDRPSIRAFDMRALRVDGDVNPTVRRPEE